MTAVRSDRSVRPSTSARWCAAGAATTAAPAVGLLGSVPPPVVFLLLFVLALHHYDLTARMEKAAPESGGGATRLG